MERFSLNVDEAVLDDLRRRLDATRWPDDGAGRPRGLAPRRARSPRYWRDGYDWRAAEADAERFEQFTRRRRALHRRGRRARRCC